MKRFVLFFAVMMLCTHTNKAQSFGSLKDSILEVHASKIKMTNPDHGQVLSHDTRGLVYLMDSSLSYNWDVINNVWGTTAHYRRIYRYNDDGVSLGYSYYAWRSTTNEWVSRYEIQLVYNQAGNLSEWILNDYDTLTNTWVPGEHDYLVYNNANKLTEETWNFYNKTNGSWFVGYLWKYDDAGRLTEEYYKSWDYQTYVINSGSHSTYILNNTGRPTETTEQEWSTLTNDWVNISQFSDQYTNDTILVTEIISNWTNSSWEPFRQCTNTYTGDLLSGQLTQAWNTTTLTWNDFSRDEYSHTFDFLTSQLTQNWDENTMTWINYRQISYIYYTSGLQAEKLIQLWDGLTWENYSRLNSTWDDLGRNTLNLTQLWKEIYHIWLNSLSVSTAYNNEGQVTDYAYLNYDFTTGDPKFGYNYIYSFDINNLNNQSVFRSWSTTSNEWQNFSLTNYYYSLYNFLGINEPGPETVSLFPNPATNELRIGKLLTGAVITLCDLKGTVLLCKTAISGTETIDIRKLSPGLYLVKVKDPKSIAVNKFVKE